MQDPEVQKAQKLFDQWREQEDSRTRGNREQTLQNNPSTTMLYVDAGFRDPDYLDEVLNDWLAQDGSVIEKPSDDPERAETLQQYQTAKEKVEQLIAEEEKKKQQS